LQGIVANDVSRRDVGFDANDNEGVLYFDDGSRVELQKSSKFNIANLILEAAARFMRYE
jgi:phosphopantothenoylcysteine synthetase/decarboxylase